MISFIIDQYKQSKALRYVVIAFVLLSLWWISIYARSLTEGLENDIFTCIYGLLALVGGSYGWFFARKWGGFRSVLGRSMGFFSIGLFAQFLGQVFYNSYIYILGIEVPYPSFGDILFFGSVIFYILGAYQLAKVGKYWRSLFRWRF